MKQRLYPLLSFVLLQSGWFITVWGAAAGYPFAGPVAVAGIVLFFLLREKKWKQDLPFLVFAAVIGFIVEAGKKYSGLIVYHSDTFSSEMLPPVYIVTLWILYGLSMPRSLGWMCGNFG